MSNGLDPDQDRLSVGPYLFQTACKFYADETKVTLARKELRLYEFEQTFDMSSTVTFNTWVI